MKIVSYHKKRDNLYELILENNEHLLLYDDIILKHELLLKKEIDVQLINQLLEENKYLESYFIALKYISKKMRSEKEIKAKLKNYPKDVKDYVIERLKQEGYLNSSIYVEAYINDAINLKEMGPNKILKELLKLGLEEELIKEKLNKVNNDMWKQKIEHYIIKKVKANKNLSINMLKNKIKNELINKGYFIDNINDVLEKINFPKDNDIYEREKEKITKKLAKKYSGEDLEFRIKMALIKKGFTNVE